MWKNADIAPFFGKQMRIEDILLIYFKQIVRFCAIINAPQLVCENSSLNSAFKKGYFCVNPRNFTSAQKYFSTNAICDNWHRFHV